MNIVHKARKFAIIKHGTQKDDDGKFFFYSHVEQVVAILERITKDEDILAAAFLHDTLEDTDTTYLDLVGEFGYRIADLVLEVTHVRKVDDSGYSFPYLESKEAILIKFADRLSNLSRMNSWNETRQRKYLDKSKFWDSII